MIRKSSGLAGAFGEKAFDFFNSEANVVAEFERWQIAEASLFSDPRFRNAEELGEFARAQQVYCPAWLGLSSRCARSASARAAHLLES